MLLTEGGSGSLQGFLGLVISHACNVLLRGLLLVRVYWLNTLHSKKGSQGAVLESFD